jgi:hypothetical protein
VGELQSSQDALAADDLHALPAAQVLDRVAELVQVANRVAAELTRTVRHAESKTMQSWLRGHARLSPAAASRVVASGRAPEHLPAVAAGFADGVITAEQVAVVAPVAAGESQQAAQAQHVDLSEIDAALAEVAATQPHVHLARVGTTTCPAWTPTAPSRTPPRGGR